MKQVLHSFMNHKDLQLLSISVGSILTLIFNFFSTLHERFFLGITASLWLIALIINVIDIHTGIKADTARKKKDGENFKFESGKGWRAFEKILIFTLIIWFLWTLEKEIVRLKTYDFLLSIILAIKFILFIYVILIELQSIGENEIDRFGKKSKPFLLLDKIIEAVNEGVVNKVKKIFE